LENKKTKLTKEGESPVLNLFFSCLTENTFLFSTSRVVWKYSTKLVVNSI